MLKYNNLPYRHFPGGKVYTNVIFIVVVVGFSGGTGRQVEQERGVVTSGQEIYFFSYPPSIERC